MASKALPHKTGGYRAYKKIAGREFQFYSRNQEEANRMQEKYDELAALKAKKVFSKCGRLLGFRFKLYTRADRKPRIIMRVQVGAFRNQKITEWRYGGTFEENWLRIKSTWAEFHALHKVDVVGYAEELKIAKKLYIQDVGALEEKLRELESTTAEVK